MILSKGLWYDPSNYNPKEQDYDPKERIMILKEGLWSLKKGYDHKEQNYDPKEQDYGSL